MIEKYFAKLASATEPTEKGLFLTSVAYSLFHLWMMVESFLERTAAPPEDMIAVHVMFLGMLYVVPKELNRRMKNGAAASPSNRPGHLLVLAWLATFCWMCYLVHQDGSTYKLPEGMKAMTLALIGALGVTRIHKMRAQKAPASTDPGPPSEKTSP